MLINSELRELFCAHLTCFSQRYADSELELERAVRDYSAHRAAATRSLWARIRLCMDLDGAFRKMRVRNGDGFKCSCSKVKEGQR